MGRSDHLKFHLEKASASRKEGEPVISVWLNRIHQQVASKL